MSNLIDHQNDRHGHRLPSPLIKGGLRGILGNIKSLLSPLFQRGGIARQICLIGGLIALLACAKGYAAIDPFEFENESQRQRYQQFIDDLRCPKCQNQNLAGSDAPIAADLRQELRRLLQENKTDREIIDFMVARYGEFVLYDPPFDKKTAVLWLAPIGFLAIGLIVLMTIARRRATAAIAPAELSESERAQLQQLLHDDKNPGDKSA